MCLRIRSTGAASVMNAMLRIAAPPLGPVSGSDSNSRACSDQGSMAQRLRAGERVFAAEAAGRAATSAEALGSPAASRPSAVATSRRGELGASTP